MTNDVSAALARIDSALQRIEHVVATRRVATAPGDDVRYEQLRARTQAALAELDGVIARVAEGERV